jgi:hypothetical protein
MIPLVLAAMFLGLVTTASGQRRGQPGSPGGYGNIVHPGTGHASFTPLSRAAWPTFLGRQRSAARPISGSTATLESSDTPGWTVVIPTPIYDNSNLDEEPGMYWPADGNPPQALQNLDDRPPVIIDQNFASPRDASHFANQYPVTGPEFGPPVSQTPANSCGSSVQATPKAVENGGKPTIYLIAFKDHSIVEALGYWTEGTMFHYVSVEYAFNHASIALLDPDLSRRLNRERGIKFKLNDLD